MSILTSLTGVLVVEIASADIPKTLDLICRQKICLWDISYQDHLTIRVRISWHDWKQLKSLLERYGCTCHLIAREGIRRNIHGILTRPVLILGIVLFFLTAFYIPSRVFFVHIEGNAAVCSNRILETASSLGIRFGASRRHVRSEAVKNGLLSAIEELEWAGVNTKGCIAIISVRECPKQGTSNPPQSPGDVIALRDGIVLSCDITRGNGVCVPNQAVKMGQILISGTVDHGSTVSFTSAEGEVFAATQRDITVLTHAKTQMRGANGVQNIKFRLLIGKKLINFFKGSGISGGSCVKMYSKYVLTLPGGFELPIALVQETLIERTLSEEIQDQQKVRELLSDFASDYIRNQMIAGRILVAGEKMSIRDEVYQLSGNYACTEMIGRVQQEQIGAYHGKTD